MAGEGHLLLPVGGPRPVLSRGMRYDKTGEGLKSRMELATIILIDTGRERPSFAYVSIADTHRRLWPDVNRLIASIRVTG